MKCPQSNQNQDESQFARSGEDFNKKEDKKMSKMSRMKHELKEKVNNAMNDYHLKEEILSLAKTLKLK